MADNAVVWWEEDEAAAYVRTDSLLLCAPEDEFVLEANGRMIWCEYGLFTENDTMYIPLSGAAKAFGFDTTYIYENNTTYLVRERSAAVPAEEFYDEEELHWLSKIIHAEAQGEPFDGKLAVGNVILNRVESDEFPDTVYDVIFDNEHGVQFTPTVNGAIHKEPNEDSILAAMLCLDGAVLDETMLYFLNERIASSLWIPQNRDFVMAIGEHKFYS
jgi:N-acetylmuramoyl-L-alanine amidase